MGPLARRGPDPRGRRSATAATVNHRGDLRAELVAAAPDGVDWIFTSGLGVEGQLDLYVDILRPFGEIVAIDDPESLDGLAMKPKSLSLHWESMFARPTAGGEAQLEQHRLLTRVAELVDAGSIRTTATTVLTPLDAARLREAHALVEDGHVVGKVVVARTEADASDGWAEATPP
ncbi:MAG: zinc-binding dehydrogenase [Solirubrobacterales bacterium]|nr:zinc-binding dehydrogenase [Solirubrobacterales bacterium]